MIQHEFELHSDDGRTCRQHGKFRSPLVEVQEKSLNASSCLQMKMSLVQTRGSRGDAT